MTPAAAPAIATGRLVSVDPATLAPLGEDAPGLARRTRAVWVGRGALVDAAGRARGRG